MANPLNGIKRFLNETVPDWVRRMSPARGFRTYRVGSALVGLSTPEDALKIATAWRCVNLISQSVAMLPWGVYRRNANGDGERQRNHPVEWLLHHEASAEMTAFDFKRAIKAHSLLWGNGYAEIERDMANRPYALHLLDPSRVEPGRDGAGRVVYKVRQADGGEIILPAADMYHIHGPGFDGLRGYSVLEYAAAPLAMAMAFDKSLQKFFRDGFRPMGFFKTKGRMSLEAFQALEKRIDEFSGLDNRWKALPLDQEMEFEPLSVAPEDAQLVDLRKLSAIDICRLFDVPPHLAFDLDRATFSNIESQGREFLTYGLMAHIVQMEQEADRKLLTRGWGGLYTKLNVNALVRADIEKRAAFYQLMLNSGAMNINEVRANEELPNIGPDGDVYVRQVQYQPIGAELQQPTPVKQTPLAEPPPPKKNGSAHAHMNGSH